MQSTSSCKPIAAGDSCAGFPFASHPTAGAAGCPDASSSDPEAVRRIAVSAIGKKPSTFFPPHLKRHFPSPSIEPMGPIWPVVVQQLRSGSGALRRPTKKRSVHNRTCFVSGAEPCDTDRERLRRGHRVLVEALKPLLKGQGRLLQGGVDKLGAGAGFTGFPKYRIRRGFH